VTERSLEYRVKTETDPLKAVPPRRLSHDGRIFLMALLAGLPALLVSMILLWRGDYPARAQWTLTVVVVSVWLGFAASIRYHVVFPLQTLSNLLAALREGDYSIRGREARERDALGDVTREINDLAQTLHAQRLDALEATALLRKVMEEIDVAVFSFDGERRLRLVNRAGERLLKTSQELLLGQSAEDLGLDIFLQGDAPSLVDAGFPGSTGRWEVRRSTFRQGGLPHQLLVLSDLTRALREEELKAWQRIVRVIGHELNNSLAPIKSISGSLRALMSKPSRPADWEEDMRRGLSVIGSRSESLGRFMEAYARLARLPQPKLQPVDIGSLVRRAAGLETRVEVRLKPGPDVIVQADPDQIEQLMINLIRNAVDAAMETGGGVTSGWTLTPGHVDVWIQDEGPGLANTTNLFVPFFTTKPGGSGIGLVLSRQIAEAHGGSLTLDNRKNASGCEARLRLQVVQ
jgi:nitrogen fixation/metabolism regulation signal transduction histidine kinase